MRVRVRENLHLARHCLSSVDTSCVFDYERLDVYQCALKYAALSFKIIDELPRGHSCRYHSIARGSAMECGALIDMIRLLGLEGDRTTQARGLLIRIVSMLSKMAR